MIEYLKRPSPVLEKISSRVLLVFCVSVFVYLFLVTFQPFGLDDSFVQSSAIVSIGYAGLSFIVFNALMLWVNPWLLNKYKERFTLGVEIVTIFSFITILGVINGAYSLFVLKEQYLASKSTVDIFTLQILYTHAVALFPTIIVLFFFELRERNYYVQQSDLIKKNDSFFAQEEKELEISGDSADEKLLLNRGDFLFAKASGNYVDVHYFQNEEIAKKVFRLTLSGLLSQISYDSDWMFQTHRSYVVNLSNVSKVEGNAQGYTLTMKQGEEKVPVSRGKISGFNAVMNGI